nr:uncharacterized protein LOC110385559 isoform X1 [Bombyx mori]XP_037867587.1 uncharacterized protein LOC110385559 isoform X2 [Bombyx mori]XP_037871009.1 uncharacterized protein LOC119629396 isoform X1 [Bombyx mori]XP_037871010.1 uncharacterized protein LOC119629396 isoform X2 [Bombyx mori]
MPPKSNKSENDLKLLYAKRDMIYSRVQTICDNALKISDLAIRDSFLCSIENIDDLRADFESIVHNINALQLELDPDYAVSYSVMSSFDDLYCRIKRVAKSLGKIPSAGYSQTEPKFTRDRPRLPPIHIPEFNGDIRNWGLFIDSFENTVNQNDHLTDHEKLHYLVEKLTGKARAACAGITFSAENYSLILNTLKAKYEDKRLIATAYLDQLFELKPILSCTEQNLEKFLDIFASSVRAIRNLNVNDLSDFLFLYIGLKKLDFETVRLFETNQGTKGIELPKFNELESFLRNHIRILQRTTRPHEVPKRQPERHLETSSRPLRTTHSYVNTAALPASVPAKSTCFLCKSYHTQLYQCAEFLKLSPKNRYDFVRTNNLCLNCLSDKHRVGVCNSSHSCRKCSLKHHTLLHFDKNNNIVANRTTSAGNQPMYGNSSLAVSSSEHSHGRTHAGGTARCTTHLARPTYSPALPAAAVAAARTDSSAAINSDGNTNDVTLCSLSSARLPTTVLLATARVVMVDTYGKPHLVRALLDSASQSNFITRECCQRLGLKYSNQPTCPVVKGIGGSTKDIQGSVKIKFESRFSSNVSFEINSLVVDKVTEQLPTVSVDTSLLANFDSLPLADDTYAVPGAVDILIGASIFPHLLLPRKVQGHSANPAPHALETVLGFVIVGSAPALINSYSTVSYCCAVEPPLDSTVRRFWEIEEVNVPLVMSPDDKTAEDIYCSTTTRDESGRYIVALPFKGDTFSLGDSRLMAEKRFFCLERKMMASPKLKKAYDDVVNEYVDKGIISPAPAVLDETQNGPSYVIPHHGVIREDKLTTKLRVVLDGSAKTSTSVSLNDILYCGKNLQGNLFDIIVNFRLFIVALSADIRQMFLCIGIRESDRRFQRFLYRFSYRMDSSE